MASDANALAEATLALARSRRRAPTATYRLQMHAGFTFRDATRIVPYLAALGISHLYLSPILKARPGSLHGYDTIDPRSLDPEIGTEEEFRALVSAAQAQRMGVVLDIVPNHMAVDPANPWWRDVFEHGPSSPYAGYFDIAWDDPPRPDLRGRVMLPILGSPYYQVLEAGELSIELAGGELQVRVYQSSLPLDPRTYDQVLKPALDRLGGGAEEPSAPAAELQSILTAIKHLPPRTETDPERIREGRAETEVIKRRIATLVETEPGAAEALRAAADEFRITAGSPEARQRLDALLDAQAFRLCFWRVASDEINYRRFFDINELSALAAEREDVFRDTHSLILKLAAEGLVGGLRIDHPDGLFDPRQYLTRLQEHYLLECARRIAQADASFAESDWADLEPELRSRFRTGPDAPPLYVVVEKILERSERLSVDWPVAGATGYELLNAANGLFVDPAGADPLTRTYQQLTEKGEAYSEIVFRTKLQVLWSAFSSELSMLANQLDRLARTNRQARDFTLNGLRRSLRPVIAAFPRYRSYVVDEVVPADERAIRRAVRDARRRSPTLSQEVFDFVRDTLLLVPPPAGTTTDDYAAGQRRFVGKFQQVTAPVTAKGVEDTAFYVYNRLASLNEVGGDPARFGWTPAEVHNFLADRQIHHPGSLSPGATHDTKRGEDVRARLNVLSELPGEWSARVTRWFALNRGNRVELEEGFLAPDPNDEYLLYQTLVGAWPADAGTRDGLERFAERVKEYMHKATHEAKVHTSWINPNPEYDSAVREFVTRCLDPDRSSEFLEDVRSFHGRVAFFGAINSLALTLLRCTAPGVPDTYQGTELWDLSLVDPDNRRPVDFDHRRRLLEELDGTGTPPADLTDGRTKLFLASRALRLRRAHPALFEQGEYEPVEARGEKADHLFAFTRRHGGRTVLVVVPRLVVRLLGGTEAWPPHPDFWGDTRLALEKSGSWTNVLTGEQLTGDDCTPGRLLDRLPVALLTDADGK